MSTFRRILVAVKNPWARSLPAIAKAAQLASKFDARLQLFHGMTDPVYFQVGQVQQDDLASDVEKSRRMRVVKRLQTLTRRLDRSDLAADVAVEWDYPAHEAIIRAARRFNADLVVAERHATPHHLPWLLHFTDFELLRLAPMPVLLIKTRQRYKRPRILAAVDPSHEYSKPIHLDRVILRCSTALASALRGTLYAVHAFDPLPIVGAATEVPFGEAAEVLETVTEARARKALDQILSGVDVPPARRCLVPRHPSDAIDNMAREIGSSIVVMGALSRSGLKRLVLGNTAERLLDHLRCDVLVVKPREFVSRVPRSPRGPQLIALPEFRE